MKLITLTGSNNIITIAAVATHLDSTAESSQNIFKKYGF